VDTTVIATQPLDFIGFLIYNLILPRIGGGVKASDILFQKEEKGHAKGSKDLYSRVIPREAVQLAQTSGKPITQIARELGISDTSIHQWRKELTEHGPEAFEG
jgi:transposase